MSTYIYPWQVGKLSKLREKENKKDGEWNDAFRHDKKQQPMRDII